MPEHDHHWMHRWSPDHSWGYGPAGPPDMLLSALSTIFWLALLIGLVWFLLRWIIPYVLPMLAGIFGRVHEDAPSLEILRQRFAAGEIDAVTFERMRERLMASFPHNEPLFADDYYAPPQEHPWQRSRPD